MPSALFGQVVNRQRAVALRGLLLGTFTAKSVERSGIMLNADQVAVAGQRYEFVGNVGRTLYAGDVLPVENKQRAAAAIYGPAESAGATIFRASGSGSSTDVLPPDLTQFLLASGARVGASSQRQVFTTGIVIEAAGSIGIGTMAMPIGKLDIAGTSATDLPPYSAEFLLATDWTATGWTGSFAAGWTHTPGNTSVLSQSKAAVNATKYQIAYTVTGWTAGSFTLAFGGESLAGITATGAFGPKTISTANLTITPSSDFDGAIVISIKSITYISIPLVNLKASDGSVGVEMRAGPSSLWNTFIGAGAGAYNTTGSNNTAYGVTCLTYNTTGYANTANGANALAKNTTGRLNTAFGYGSLCFNTTGHYNTASGANALFYNTTGNYNIACGVNAGRTLITGSANTFLGYDAGYNALQLTSALNSMALGYGTYTTADNQVVIGNADVAETLLHGKVGIGTIPVTQLHVLLSSAVTAAISTVLTLGHNSTGTPAAGFGAQVMFQLASNTTADRNVAALAASWIVATDASRTGRLALYARDYGALREGLRIDTDGSAVLLSFYAHAAVAQQTGVAVTAVAIHAALVALGLITA
jgi:hypothetical protein